jgi:hypothetical protein
MNKKIKVALLDSGITNGVVSDVINVPLYNDCNDFSDEINHGNICSKIIKSISPDVQIYNIKIVGNKFTTSPIKIINAIKWCNNNNIDVINLSISVCDLDYYFDFSNVCHQSKNNNIYIVSSGDNIGKPCLPAYLNSVFGVGVARLPINEYMFNEQEQIQFYANGEYDDLEHSNIYSNIHQTSFATARITGLICKILFKQKIKNYIDLIPILKNYSTKFNTQDIIVKNHYIDLTKHTKMISFKENNILNSLKNKEIIFIGSYMDSLFLKNHNHSNFSIGDVYSIERDKEINLFENRGIPTFHLPPMENGQTGKNILIGDIPPYLLSQVADKFPCQTLYTLFSNHICKDINIKYCFKNVKEIEKNSMIFLLSIFLMMRNQIFYFSI